MHKLMHERGTGDRNKNMGSWHFKEMGHLRALEYNILFNMCLNWNSL